MDKVALHQLKLEISENENRKDFSFSEKMEWADKLKDEYSKIARENQKGGQGGILLSPMLDEAKRTDESVAKDLDMGKTTYRKAEYIYKNADEDTIKQLNEEKISINKAWVETKTTKGENVNEKNRLDQFIIRKWWKYRGITRDTSRFKDGFVWAM